MTKPQCANALGSVKINYWSRGELTTSDKQNTNETRTCSEGLRPSLESSNQSCQCHTRVPGLHANKEKQRKKRQRKGHHTESCLGTKCRAPFHLH